MFAKKFIGDRAFYRNLLIVMIPILIQNVITNFVNLLDNIMVGQVGTEPMSGVAIVNQLIFVFNLCIFGGTAGAGILAAQFHGKGDVGGVRSSFRMKLLIAFTTFLVALAILLPFGDALIGLFLHEGEEALDLNATLAYGKDYLSIMLWQLLPFSIIQVYASTLRETGETMLPMKAGIISVFVNLILNYLLIFGKLGFPVLGVVGAAIATVIARLTELLICIIYTHSHEKKHPFIHRVYHSFRVPLPLVRQILILGAPLLLNELLWSSGMTTLNQCYSTRGLEIVSATNISTTASNLFFCAFFSMGSAISILVGQLLGSGKLEEAVDADRKMIAFSVALCALIGILMIFLSPLIPQIYNTTATVKHIATQFLFVTACMMPIHAFTHACYFTLRSGGKTLITMIFDSFFMWLIAVPVAFSLSRFTTLPILPLFIIVQSLELLKVLLGSYMVNKRMWVKNLVAE